eukprot:evm.model.scf_1668.2 EVM.evm.TU.scf_1668.2   scf_1668:6072-7356(-)
MVPAMPTAASGVAPGSAHARPAAAGRPATAPNAPRRSARGPSRGGGPVKGQSEDAARREEWEETREAEGAPRGWRAVLRAFMVDGDDQPERTGVNGDIPVDDALFAIPHHSSM